MKSLCLDHPSPSATIERYQPHLEAEVRHTWESSKKGVIRDIYFRRDRPGVALLLECESTDPPFA
jgi:hypothetical protein